MSQKKMLEAKGLYTDPNLLSKVPDGALVEANNIIIDREGIIEPRRGFRAFGDAFGDLSDRAKQLLSYKERLLIHYSNKLLYNSIDHNGVDEGVFLEFDGTYDELEPGLRIKFIESNKNLFFTTNDGIKKIAARTAADFTTAADYIRDAGGAKALDVIGSVTTSDTGFLLANSKVAYRIVWGYRDVNDNLIIGSPSSRLVISNLNSTSATVNLEFVVPQNVTEDHFYQVYRTAIITATGNLNLDDIDPGDDMQLVFEEFPTAAEFSTKFVSIEDITPEEFRNGGDFLYTNPNSGEGILQANEPPPIAKDITLYQSTAFYANTESRSNIDVSMLGVQGMTSGTSSITVDDGTNPPRTYTFVGEKEDRLVDFTAYAGTIPADIDGKYFLINSASNDRKYYVWYDDSLTTQTIDFSGFIGTIPDDLNGKHVVFYTPEDNYYIWFDNNVTATDPGLTNASLAGMIGTRIDITGLVNAPQVLAEIETNLNAIDVEDIFDINYVGGTDTLDFVTRSFDTTALGTNQNIQQGFINTISTAANNDPSNDTITNTDVVGRFGITVSVARNVTNNTELTDATAAAIVEQDASSDFNVTYAGGTTFNIENTNNGNTDDATDSAINPIGMGFSISVTVQGDGEDPALNEVLLSAAATPSQQIDESARSLVNIINRDTSGSVYAFYISGNNDIPGKILFESRDIGNNQFNITANDATTGALFNPSLPPATGANPVTGEAEIKPNRIFYSKLQQPEAVPLVNFIDVGPEDKEISRILALRESLFILKEDGVYRLTGLDGNYVVDLFDESTKIIAPDTAVVLNNQIYCLTNQGVAVISDTGIDIISKQLDNIFQVITSSRYDFRLTSFGVSYETDRCYWLWVPSSPSDTVATQAFRYNTFTRSWTRHTIGKTCGIVLDADDKIYLGPSDLNSVEIERKNFDRTDYADRQFDLNILADSVNGYTIKLNQTNVATVGDAIVQTQYLTINDFNRLLEKIDLDPFTGESEQTLFDFTSYTGTVLDLNTKYFLLNSASNINRFAVVLDTTGSLTQLDPIVFSDLRNVTQIVVDISSAFNLADVAEAIVTTVRSNTAELVLTHTPGNLFFRTRTVRNGEVDDASDSTINGLLNGFAVTIEVQGFGDYLENNRASAGDNLLFNLNALATQLDQDPNVADNNYLASLPAVTDFESLQTAFNVLVDKLNLDAGVLYSNYLRSEGTFELEALILEAEFNSTDVTVEFSLNFIEGPIILYKGVNSQILYAPEHFGDPSIHKQVREGTFLFENATFSRGTVGYTSDLSPGLETIPFTKNGKGDWGYFLWSNQNWGGGFSGIPLRTLIPRSKQRSRYIQAYYLHVSAREKWGILGVSYTFRPISEKAYRD